MLRKSLMTFAVAAVFAASAFAQTADEVIEKNIQARGGREKIKSVQSLRATGKRTFGPGIEAPFVIEFARPAQMRLEFVVQGMTGIITSDGTAGWQLMPFMGKKEAEAMSEDELKSVKDQADFDGAFVDYKEKGNQVEYLGKVDLEGAPAYKLKVTKKSGDVETVYFDVDSSLVIQREGKTSMRGQEVETVTTFGDYKEVDGSLYFFSSETKQKGASGPGGGFSMTIEKIEVNPTLAADRFGKPASLAAPAAPEPPK
ncbi:MAG TPA: hypothetical protein VGS22_21675 [Thermoanaerobaculia bacterium]|jgi:outer membrane lipoprotein-sorting protein|nr:hypothetical protein [Thermoanaerobaculia bacterium]